MERTGEISSGIDVWAKRTRKPVIEKWYFGADYHKDHGEGLDFYKVGPSRGCGGTGISRDGKVYAAKNFVTWKILENGPKRVVFEVGYAPYDAGGVLVRESRKIALEAGSHLNRVETRFDWEGRPENLEAVVGIVKRARTDAPEFIEGSSALVYWEAETGGDGSLGTAVVMTTGAKFENATDQAFLKVAVRRGQPLTYYTGAAWTKSDDFPDREAWTRHIKSFAGKVK